MKKYVSIGVMLTLMSGKRYSAPALAQKYETSVKTIYRSIETLLEAGLPIVCYSGKNGGYELVDDKEYTTSFFTTEELSAFITFLKTSKGLCGDLALEDRLEKFAKPFGGKVSEMCGRVIIDTDIWGDEKGKVGLVDSIKTAIDENRRLFISYRSSYATQRTIEPYALVYKAGVWYVYAYCNKRQSFRLFRLSRISQIKVLEEQFERRDIDLTSKPWNKDFVDNFEPIDICLRVDSSSLPELYDWLDMNKTTFKNGMIKAQAYFSQGLVHRLMQFGEKVTVVAPQKLRDAIKSECLKIVGQYS